MDHEFLDKSIDTWESDPGYIIAQDKIKSLSVVNDGVEWECKLAHDFLETACMEENLENVLQFVENGKTFNAKSEKEETEI